MFKHIFLITTLTICSQKSICQNSLNVAIDSAKDFFTSHQKDGKAYVSTCFFILDNYMDLEQYDSAQIWLNKIHEKIPAKKPSLFNYFLLTRQAEVYYYNNLQQLGLQESFKGLAVAQTLKDSFLLADSYNFLGLFYMNLDSSKEAIPFYKNGLRFVRQPPYPKEYLSLTKPHHLYGNLSEAYFKIKNYDSALYNIKLSLKKAYEINWLRGIAVGHTSAGDIFFALQNTDSAFSNYQKGKLAAEQSKDIDVELLSVGGIAKCLNALNNFDASKKELDKAFLILKNYPSLNRFFALQFLNTAIEIYKERNESVLLSKALEVKSSIEMANVKTNNDQIQTILKASVENEKRTLSLEVSEAKQKQNLANTRTLFALSAFAILGMGFLLYRRIQLEKLNSAKIRQKISHDLHDDIGASLSSLQIYGAIAEQTIYKNPSKAIEMVQKISTQSKHLMENMNDIVWSMKSGTDTATSLEAKIKNFGVELLSDKDIKFTYNISQEVEGILQSIQVRKNILLLIKEAMNNIAKYSKTCDAELTMEIRDKNLVLEISDEGIGFDETKVIGGNGIKNMHYRVKELKGEITIKTASGKGTKIIVSIPIAIIKKAT